MESLKCVYGEFKICPNLIGVDIGCAVSTWNTLQKYIDFLKFDEFVKNSVPTGFNQRTKIHDKIEMLYNLIDSNEIPLYKDFEIRVNDIINKMNLKSQTVWGSLGSLGSGNHFMELNISDTKELWLTIHSGSRNFGLQICNFHQKIAVNNCGKMGGLEYLEGIEADNYIQDMKVAQVYAKLNRIIMGYEILTNFFNVDIHNVETFESVHNYIDFKDNVIRKGAISAHKDEKVIIPLNMAEGCIIGYGKGNCDWNWSAPHGAGRKLARKQAKKKLTLMEFEKVMKDANVYSSCIVQITLDESPMAYKPSKEILEYIEDTVDIKAILKPVYNFKAIEE